MSVLKIIKLKKFKDKNYNDGKLNFIIDAIYMGTVFESVLEKHKISLKEQFMIEAKKSKKYDPNEKYGGKVADPKYAKRISDAIKRGELKFKQPKKK